MLRKYSNWKIVLPSSILFFLYTLIIFPFYLSQINETANEKVLFLDGRLNYNYEQVNTLFNKMGREGRDIYHFMAGRVDMIYPIKNTNQSFKVIPSYSTSYVCNSLVKLLTAF